MFFSKTMVAEAPKHLVSLCVPGKIIPSSKIVDKGFENTVCCRCFLHSTSFIGCGKNLIRVPKHGQAHASSLPESAGSREWKVRSCHPEAATNVEKNVESKNWCCLQSLMYVDLEL